MDQRSIAEELFLTRLMKEATMGLHLNATLVISTQLSPA